MGGKRTLAAWHANGVIGREGDNDSPTIAPFIQDIERRLHRLGDVGDSLDWQFFALVAHRFSRSVNV